MLFIGWTLGWLSAGPGGAGGPRPVEKSIMRRQMCFSKKSERERETTIRFSSKFEFKVWLQNKIILSWGLKKNAFLFIPPTWITTLKHCKILTFNVISFKNFYLWHFLMSLFVKVLFSALLIWKNWDIFLICSQSHKRVSV